MRPVYSVIVPCYNEEDCIRETHSRLTRVMQGMEEPYEILYINDGSRDRTAGMLDDLVEGVYLGRFEFNPAMILLVFEIARQGDPQALEVIRWAGSELGMMAVSVINQLGLQNEEFEVVLIGSLYDGHPLMTESMRTTIHRIAPGARLVRLTAPPVVGGVILGMQAVGQDARPVRSKLIETTLKLRSKISE